MKLATRVLVTAAACGAFALTGTMSASASTSAPGDREYGVALATECPPTCTPPALPPKECVPRTVWDGTFIWQYRETKTFTNAHGHGWKVHVYNQAYHGGESYGTRSTCKINF